MKSFFTKKTIQSIIVVVALFLIIRYFATHRDELLILRHIRPQHLIGLTALTFVAYMAYAANILIILRKLGLKISNIAWFKLFIISRYINFHVTQGRNIYLSIKLKEDYGFSYTRSFSMIAFTAWLYTLSTFVYSLGFLLLTTGDTYHSLIVTLIVLIVICWILPFLAEQLLLNFPARNSKIIWIKSKLDDFRSFLKLSMTNKEIWMGTWGYSFVIFTVYLMMVHLGFLAIAHPFPFHQTILYTIVLTTSRYFNVVPGNIGITEYLCGYLTESLGGSLSSGIIVSGLVRIIDYLLAAILGLSFSKGLLPHFKNNKNYGDSSSAY
ncbi:MAG: lysylphosphatidylglycerol synthase transmembrane domain-containing protein [Candidatus Omnitrophota bacterium]|nr:lysylphosphatidylglycerol synthase transmembrane domain-containing protein [Candidatus Omnitrophota bacterium]